MNGAWRRRAIAIEAAILALAVPSAAAAQANASLPAGRPAPIATSAFAARSPYNSVPQISPDGSRLVYSTAGADHETITVIDIDSVRAIRRLPLDPGQELQWIQWAGDKRLLLSVSLPTSIYGYDFRITRLFVVQLDTGGTTYVGTKTQGLYGDNVIYLDPAGEFALLSLQRDLLSEPQVWRFRLDGTDVKGEQIERKSGVWEWIADDKGVVRVGLGIESTVLKVWYRKTEQEPFHVIARIGRDDDKEELWDVVRVIAGSDEGLVLEPGKSGHLALRRFNMATREVGDILYENADWDLDSVDLDETGQPLAIHFTDDRERVVWLKPELADLQEKLEKALGKDQVRIVQRSRNGARMLVSSGDASDPGAWYIYTPKTHHLDEFAELRPEIDPARLAPVKPVEYTARDGTKIHAYFTLPRGREAKGLPLIVMPHGGPYGIRDKLDYSDEVQLLADRGYAVLQPNFRGSGGYGQSFEDLGKGEIGRRMQDDLDDAVDWAAKQGIDPTRVCLVGASYGGYAALWGVIRNPERYRCAASFAGVTEWDKQLAYDADYFTSKDRRAWRDRIRGDRKFDLDTVSPARQAALLKRPVLLVHGKKDSNVPFSQLELMRNAIDRAHVHGAEYVTLENAGHGFSTAADEQKWYDSLLAFLARYNPPDAADGAPPGLKPS
jgi:dipeptidyl aminopeptidase/acylaminoacyl peptidase